MKEFEEWLQRQHYLAVMEALELHNKGWRVAEIVVFFKERYGVGISPSTISRWIRESKRRGYHGNQKQD